MKCKKWISQKHQYEECEISDNCSLFEVDMDKEIDCCSCGKKIKFGDGFTSRVYHNNFGFGYVECEECYDKHRGLV